jgi:deoxycytidine triphosphate deaminase
MAKGSSDTPNPDIDVRGSATGLPVQHDASGAAGDAAPVQGSISKPGLSQTDQPLSGKESDLKPLAFLPTEIKEEEPHLQEPPIKPPQKEPVLQVSPEPNYSGVLTENEIKSLSLIQVPEVEREEKRCYQPASYDLRLGAEYVMPRRDGQLVISDCRANGMLTIAPFATSIVSTYELVALPSNVVGRFNLRIQHALEGLIVQMGTQVEPNYEGRLFALLHNITNRPKTLKFRDYETRPFTIEFSYTSQPAPPPAERKKQRKTFSDFIPPNYARGGLDLVLEDIHHVQEENTRLSQDLNAKKMLVFTGIFLLLIVATATVFIPWTLAKFTYDKNSFPIVNADAMAAMKYGHNHSDNADIVKEVLREIDARSSGALIVPREQFYAERLTQLKLRRDSIKGNPASATELKSIEKQINEIIELLRK